MFNSNYYTRNHAVALSNDDIFRFAPSVFAVEKHESRSERFRPIPTIQVVELLRKEGFEVVSAQQSRAREDKRDFTKHLLRMRHVNDLANANSRDRMADTHAEIVLKNANDGTAAYELMAGAYRLVCSNGLIAWSPTFESVKVRHSGTLEKVAMNVIEGTYRVVDESTHLLSKRDQWSSITLQDDARLALAEAAHVIKFGDSEGNTNTPITPRQLLTVRRSGDAGKDLWTTFNVIQENCTKSGLSAWNPNTQRRTGTRDVKSLDVDVKINRALWKLTDFFASKAA